MCNRFTQEMRERDLQWEVCIDICRYVCHHHHQLWLQPASCHQLAEWLIRRAYSCHCHSLTDHPRLLVLTSQLPHTPLHTSSSSSSSSCVVRCKHTEQQQTHIHKLSGDDGLEFCAGKVPRNTKAKYLCTSDGQFAGNVAHKRSEKQVSPLRWDTLHPALHTVLLAIWVTTNLMKSTVKPVCCSRRIARQRGGSLGHVQLDCALVCRTGDRL